MKMRNLLSTSKQAMAKRLSMLKTPPLPGQQMNHQSLKRLFSNCFCCIFNTYIDVCVFAIAHTNAEKIEKRRQIVGHTATDRAIGRHRHDNNNRHHHHHRKSSEKRTTMVGESCACATDQRSRCASRSIAALRRLETPQIPVDGNVGFRSQTHLRCHVQNYCLE
jgi:hypothetical protein